MNRHEIGFAFDLEGPMVNLEEGHVAAHLESARIVGVHLTFDEAISSLPHFIGGGDQLVATDIYIISNKTLTVDGIVKQKQALFDEWLKTLTQISTRSGLFEFLESVRSQNIPKAIGTNTDRTLAISHINRSGLNNFFNEHLLVTPEHSIKRKPDPDIYLQTAKVMNITPNQQVVFEDSPVGVKAGVAAGSTVIAIPVYNHESVHNALGEAGAVHIFSEWHDVDLDHLLELATTNMARWHANTGGRR